MIFLDQVPGTHRLRAISSVGEVFPIATTANGRACLAMLPRDEAFRLAEQEWARQNARPDVAKFDLILNDIVENGIARDDGEHTDGISAIGFAFADWLGNIHVAQKDVNARSSSHYPAIISDCFTMTSACFMLAMSTKRPL